MQMTVFTKGMSIDAQARELRQQVGALKFRTLNSIADIIADTSPVDSGTYARNHEVALRSGSFVPNVVRDPDAPRRSKGQPVDVQKARDKGREAMKEDIKGFGLLNRAGAVRSLADPGQDSFVFRNATTYAGLVEQRDAVYAQARREVSRVIAETVSERRSR